MIEFTAGDLLREKTVKELRFAIFIRHIEDLPRENGSKETRWILLLSDSGRCYLDLNVLYEHC